MINEYSTREEIAAYKAELERDIAAPAHRLDVVSREKILERAATDGWTPAQADALDQLAKEPLFQAVADGVPGAEALEQAYKAARRELTVKYFDNALESGKNRYTAFLTVIDLEKQLAERRGGPAPAYPDPVLLEACRAVEAAAQNGASSNDQIATGFGVIRDLMEKDVN